MKPRIIYLLSAFALLLFATLQISQSHEFFFLLSNKERINFETATGEYDPKGTLATINGSDVTVPGPSTTLVSNNVLGENTIGNKRIEIDLTNQRLYAFEGNTKVFDFLVSTGKGGLTPTGTFYIWIKLRYTLMTGGSKALGTYYYLPNVPYTMYFYNDQYPKWQGYGIHGTYWYTNFGHPISHGSINVKTEEVEKLYYWAHPSLNGQSSIQAMADNPGTPIIIYGTTPTN